ncbi:MAG: hypothetical protein FWD47_05710 [Treponema sp.]|nr:hypothetical protein [Treponema sp.]
MLNKKTIFILLIILIICSCVKKPENNELSFIENTATNNQSPTETKDNLHDSYIMNRSGNTTTELKIIKTIDDLFNYWVEIENGDEITWIFNRDLLNDIITSSNNSEDELYIISLFSQLVDVKNCKITLDYTAPCIITIQSGDYGEAPYHVIDRNSINNHAGVIQIVLEKNISLNNQYTLIAKNSRHEFTKNIILKPIQGFYGGDEISGYYDNILFENKFWLTDGNNWQFIVKSNNDILLNKELSQNILYSIIYDKLDETPFIINNLYYADLNKEYTYRSINEGTDIVVIYYKYNILYIPVLYLIPDKKDLDYFDIGISWKDERLKGEYVFRNYRLNELFSEDIIITESIKSIRVR